MFFLVANDILSFLNDNLNGFLGSSSGNKHHDKDASQETKTPTKTKDDDKEDSLKKPVELEVKDVLQFLLIIGKVHPTLEPSNV